LKEFVITKGARHGMTFYLSTNLMRQLSHMLPLTRSACYLSGPRFEYHFNDISQSCTIG